MLAKFLLSDALIYVSFSCFPCCSFEIQSLSINYKHREEMEGDVIAIELRINCSDRKKERDTHAHDNKTTKRQLSMKFLLFYILLVLSSFLQLNFILFFIHALLAKNWWRRIKFVHSRWYKCNREWRWNWLRLWGKRHGNLSTARLLDKAFKIYF